MLSTTSAASFHRVALTAFAVCASPIPALAASEPDEGEVIEDEDGELVLDEDDMEAVPEEPADGAPSEVYKGDSLTYINLLEPAFVQEKEERSESASNDFIKRVYVIIV